MAQKELNAILKILHGTSQQFETFADILEDGEIGYDTTVRMFKVGDGVQPWSKLPFTNSQPISVIDSLESTSTTDALSARQGHQLYTFLDLKMDANQAFKTINGQTIKGDGDIPIVTTLPIDTTLPDPGSDERVFSSKLNVTELNKRPILVQEDEYAWSLKDKSGNRAFAVTNTGHLKTKEFDSSLLPQIYAGKTDIKDSTITITQGGATKGSFTLNQAGNATIALEGGSGGSVTIDTTIPATPLDTNVPSTKLLVTQLNTKADKSELSSYAKTSDTYTKAQADTMFLLATAFSTSKFAAAGKTLTQALDEIYLHIHPAADTDYFYGYTKDPISAASSFVSKGNLELSGNKATLIVAGEDLIQCIQIVYPSGKSITALKNTTTGEPYTDTLGAEMDITISGKALKLRQANCALPIQGATFEITFA